MYSKYNPGLNRIGVLTKEGGIQRARDKKERINIEVDWITICKKKKKYI